jgi:AraC-like DNA-binding protein
VKSDSKTHVGRGRPCAVIDWRVVDRLCACACTRREIAAVLGIHEDTLSARIEEEFGLNFSAYFEQKSAPARVSLRHRQFQAAMAGNVAMLIWLGKQWLGQTEKVEQVNASDPLAELVIEFRKRSDILERTASSEDPLPGETPALTIN